MIDRKLTEAVFKGSGNIKGEEAVERFLEIVDFKTYMKNLVGRTFGRFTIEEIDYKEVFIQKVPNLGDGLKGLDFTVTFDAHLKGFKKPFSFIGIWENLEINDLYINRRDSVYILIYLYEDGEKVERLGE